jgi:glyoxylase-like metal-dependent hydrolase (beta-lactamase superfamily II)
MDTERFESYLKERNLELSGVVDTHTHADHLSGLRNAALLYPQAILAMHKSAPTRFPISKLREGDLVQQLHLGGIFTSSDYAIKVIHTPGHATDHICLLVQSEEGVQPRLLSGDCLFIGDVGRTDLGRGDTNLMYDSLFHKLLSLDPGTEVYPAHVGGKHFLESEKVNTQIGIERDTNPALQVKSKNEFTKYMTEGWPPKPPFYQEIIDINLGMISLQDVQAEMIRAGSASLQHSRA